MKDIAKTVCLTNCALDSAFADTCDEFIMRDTGQQDRTKPSLEEVLDYAQKQVAYYLNRLARAAPHEHREEMAQNAIMRIWRLYPKMDATRGVRKYVQKHCRGALLDYRRAGSGFQETRASLRSSKLNGSKAPPLTRRISTYCESEQESMELDEAIGFYIIGQEVKINEMVEINWELLSRMARKDFGLHIFVRHVLKDVELEKLTAVFGGTRERLSQVYNEFLTRIDDPSRVNDPWTNQMIYALGLSKHLGLPKEDLKLGWTFEPVDFDSMEYFWSVRRPEQVKMNIDVECSRVESPRQSLPPMDRITGAAPDGYDHLQMSFFGQSGECA
jgi:hypothetical protein